jgi:trehalose/maltose transport system substrate-binding protein
MRSRLSTTPTVVGTISPAGVTTYDEEEALKIWQAGNAAFMRNWPFAYARGSDPKSPIAGKFDVTVLPNGGNSGKNAACLGGWQLMISAYSKVPDAAADLVLYLCSAEISEETDCRLEPSSHPAGLVQRPGRTRKIYPFFKTLLDIFNNAVARPSTVTGADYNQLSTVFFQNVNKVLTGAESGKDAVDQVEGVAKSIVH